MALQQLKDRYLYALQIWCGRNTDAYFVPYRYAGEEAARHAHIRSALDKNIGDVEETVNDGRTVILLSHEDQITNRDLDLDYQGKQILVGHAEATFLPPEFLYKAALDRDPYKRLPVRHIEYDRFVQQPELWEGFMRSWSSPIDTDIPNCHFMLVRDGKPIMAIVSNSFWFYPGLKIDEHARPHMDDRFERARHALEALNYTAEAREILHRSGRQHPALSEQDHAVLDDVLDQIRGITGTDADIEKVREALGNVTVDFAVSPKPAPRRLLLPAPPDAEQPLTEQPSEPSPATPAEEPEEEQISALSGEFEVAANAKGLFKLPKDWQAQIDKEYITLFNQGSGELVCFNEAVLDDAIVDKIKHFGIGSYLFAYMQHARNNTDGRTRLDKDVLKTFRDAVDAKDAATPLKLTGHGNYFTVSLANPENINPEHSSIGKWRRLDVSVQNFVNALEEAKVPPSGPEQSH